MAKRWRFDKVSKKYERLKRTLPAQIGVIMKRHFLQSFRKEGFTDETFDPWAKRKRPDKGRRRAILVKDSHLKRSIRVQKANFKEIRAGSYGIDYARRHNRGLRGMPKRQFVGPSKVMSKQISGLIAKQLRKTFE